HDPRPRGRERVLHRERPAHVADAHAIDRHGAGVASARIAVDAVDARSERAARVAHAVVDVRAARSGVLAVAAVARGAGADVIARGARRVVARGDGRARVGRALVGGRHTLAARADEAVVARAGLGRALGARRGVRAARVPGAHAAAVRTYVGRGTGVAIVAGGVVGLWRFAAGAPGAHAQVARVVLRRAVHQRGALAQAARAHVVDRAGVAVVARRGVVLALASEHLVAGVVGAGVAVVAIQRGRGAANAGMARVARRACVAVFARPAFVEGLLRAAARRRVADAVIALVPRPGAIHDGHGIAGAGLVAVALVSAAEIGRLAPGREHAGAVVHAARRGHAAVCGARVAVGDVRIDARRPPAARRAGRRLASRGGRASARAARAAHAVAVLAVGVR